MELKTARLTLLIDPAKKEAFERLCAQQDLTPSQVVRQMIRSYLADHGATYTPSGAAPHLGAKPAPTPRAEEAPRAVRGARAPAPAAPKRLRKR